MFCVCPLNVNPSNAVLPVKLEQLLKRKFPLRFPWLSVVVGAAVAGVCTIRANADLVVPQSDMYAKVPPVAFDAVTLAPLAYRYW
jgi:hypothetical protein